MMSSLTDRYIFYRNISQLLFIATASGVETRIQSERYAALSEQKKKKNRFPIKPAFQMFSFVVKIKLPRTPN